MPVMRGGKGGQYEQNLQSDLEQNEELLRSGIGDCETQWERPYVRKLRREDNRQSDGAGTVYVAIGSLSDSRVQSACGVG